jgi:predicted HTH transcriptional regulator
VDRCAVYIGLIGLEYGSADASGVSPTEREFDRATERGKPRLIFVKGTDDAGRHPKMQALVRKAGRQLIRRRFGSIPELTAALYASLVEHLVRSGLLRTRPFDASACPQATLADISEEKVRWFLARARRERRFAIAENTPTAEALTHLNALDAGQPTHAAILLFGKQPQRFLITSEVKCLHFHGTEVRKPIPSYQVYKGTVFDLTDQAVDFVLSKIARAVGTRAKGLEAPVEYELPRDAVAEAIVNAVVHRDYTSNASVQVVLFSDRLEVWNPGELPPPLTMEKLRVPHASIPHNPLICEPMFLARYAEKAGSGILDMIALCREAGLPEPDFRQEGGQFVQTLWRDWLTEKAMEKLRLNERQRQVVRLVRGKGRITNTGYQDAFGVSKPTATRDLEELRRKGVLAKVGRTGKGTHYVLNLKGLTKGSKDSRQWQPIGREAQREAADSDPAAGREGEKTFMSDLQRFSSRRQRLDHAFLSAKLKGARSYRRIAGYFRSSIFELVGEEIAAIPKVQIVCNSDLDAADVAVSQHVRETALKERWNEVPSEVEALLHRDRYRRLHELLTSGRVEIRVVPKDRVFIHGKAGVIEAADGSKTCFLGSINQTKSAFAQNYEILWEDPSPEGVAWVEEEFEALWKDAHPLPEAIVEEIKRVADRVEIRFEEARTEELPAAALAESPIYRGGEQLQPWQRSFVTMFLQHRETYGKARLLLADEVGVGKTLSLGASAMISALLDDGPVLILCPSTLTFQWQVELTDRLGIPSAFWVSTKKVWIDPRGHIIKTRGA